MDDYYNTRPSIASSLVYSSFSCCWIEIWRWTDFSRKVFGSCSSFSIFCFLSTICRNSTILSNMQKIFEDAEISMKPSIAAVVVGSVHVIATCCSSFSVEKFGRRPTWIISSLGLSVALVLIWLNDYFNLSNVIPVVGLILYVIFFGIGFGPIPWLIVPELFPDSVRSFFQSFASTMNWIFGAAIIFLWPIMRDKLGFGWAFFCFGMVCLLSAIYGIFLMPETKGTQLGESSTIQIETLYDPLIANDWRIFHFDHFL